ncbi:MAG: hypothetical protein M3548_23130 [Actinomycetota bacterium]|nr:hypothetical protein [Actinomycetota bacterium]
MAIVVTAVVAVAERSVAAIGLGLLGAVVGVLAGLMMMQLGLLVGALALGARVREVIIGVGTRVADWSTLRRAIVLRAVPLFLSVSIGPGRAPARRRMWGAALSSAIAGVLAVALSVLAVLGRPGGFWLGVAVAVPLTVGHTLYPRKTASSTSTGWLLLNVLRLTGTRAQQLDAAPLVAETVDATQDGRLAEAATLAQRLADQFPDLRTAKAARVLVLQAHGHYVEAVMLAMSMMEDPDQTPQDAAVTFAALAGLTYATVEAGLLDPELGLSTAANALANAETLGYPSYKLDGTRALRELLTGDPRRALSLANQATKSTDDVLGRADDFATIARVHMALGDNRAARVALGEAEKLVPWWPRVTETRRRLDVA